MMTRRKIISAVYSGGEECVTYILGVHRVPRQHSEEGLLGQLRVGTVALAPAGCSVTSLFPACLTAVTMQDFLLDPQTIFQKRINSAR